MATSHFQQFLHDATSPAPDTDNPLGPDCLYGLYTSWCLLQGRTPRPGAAVRAGRPPDVLPVICSSCGTDRHLTLRSVTHLPDRPSDIVLVSHTCGRCRRFSEHPAWVADLSPLLARLEQTGDVLILGGHYMHCGQPMENAGTELRRLSVPLSTQRTSDDTLEVYLSTRVLRCVCGFQMELPE